MDRLEVYLEIVPLPVMIAVPILAVALFMLLPGKWRLPLAITIMVPWLAIGRLFEIGTFAQMAKATSIGALILVTFSAWLHPGERRQLPGLALMYPIMAVLAFAYILTVENVMFALAIKVLWLAMVIAALMVARVIVDEKSLQMVVRCMTIGFAITMFVAFSDLVRNPGEAFRAGLNRFEPYGANANQIGVVFAVIAPLALYAAMRAPGLIGKTIWFGICGMGIALGLLTASRSTMVVMVVVLIPLGVALTKRPGIVITGAIVLGLGVPFVIGMAEDTAFERFSSIETARVEGGVEYLGYVAERPIFGLLGSDEASFLEDESAVTHPHNAYIEMLYFGGLSYFIPLFIVVGMSMLAAKRIWRYRRILGVDPVLVSMLVAMMFMVYAHGFVNGSIYYPTYAWAFLHIMLSTFFLGLAADLKAGASADNLLPAMTTLVSEEHVETTEVEYELGDEYGDYREYGGGAAEPAT